MGATWSIDFQHSIFQHHSGCCSYGRPSLSLDLASVPEVRNAILSAGNYAAAMDSMRRGSLAAFMAGLGFHCTDQTRRRLVMRVFGFDPHSIALGLARLDGWVANFNAENNGHNGKATLLTMPGSVSTDKGTSDIFVSLTVVFEASASLLLTAGLRMFTCDAAHLKYERKDLRLAVLESCLCTGHSVCLAFSLGWGETTKLYTDLFQAINSFTNGDLYHHINDPKTTFITDRGPGLTTALGKFFPHA